MATMQDMAALPSRIVEGRLGAESLFIMVAKTRSHVCGGDWEHDSGLFRATCLVLVGNTTNAMPSFP